MRIVHTLMTVLIGTLFAGCGATADGQSGVLAGDGEIVVEYEPVKASLQPMQDTLEESGVLEEAATQVERVAQIPSDVLVQVKSCKVGATYYPDDDTVAFCVQEWVEFEKEVIDYGESVGDEVMDTVLGAAEATLLHELGHAVIDLRDLPISGSEEDVADQFAVWQAVEGLDNPDLVLSFEYGFRIWDDFYDQPDDDQHAAHIQRSANLLCWLYGSDPEGWADLVDDEPLTQDRADWCGDEWDQIRRAWTAFLKPTRS